VEESMMSSSSSPRSDSGNESGANATRDGLDAAAESKKPSISSVDSAVPIRSGSRVRMTSLLERLLKRYCSYMSSPLHQDRGLKFLQWTLWLVSKLARNPSHSKHLRKLYLDVSFARYVTRLLGLPAALEATMTGSWIPSSDRYGTAMKWVGRALSWSMAGYYPTEHVAYVQWMLPSAFPPERRTAERWSYISCRFWLLYVVAEATQCLLQWRELSSAPTTNGGVDDDDSKLAKVDREAALRKVKVLLTRDLLFLLPCINWSLPNWDTDPWLSETVINTLMWLESVVCLTLA
jgi:Peroxisomal biogenesis factor 11 (PEX11)